MGIAGAGNSGTVIAALAAPRLADYLGWHKVFGLALIACFKPYTLGFKRSVAKKQHIVCPSFAYSSSRFHSILIILF